MDLTIKDVPDVESVKSEIVNNALTTIANYKRSQLQPSAEALAVEAEIEIIKEKNVPKLAVAVEPVAENLEG
jgi:hypothetical protein